MVSNVSEPEVWLRGSVPAIPALLQPVAHSLLQCREELTARVTGLTPAQIWARPGGAGSIGFHARHAAGSLDRLFTYARGEMLNDAQKAAARAEAQDHPDLDGAALIGIVSAAVERALGQLRSTDPSTLLDARKIGRAGLPSTVIGCLFHGAEHTTRHAGQFISTVKILQAAG